MNMKKWIAAALVGVMAAGTLAGCCQKSSTDTARYEAAYDTGYYEMDEAAGYGAAALSVNQKSAATGSTTQALPQNRKWVITMNLTAETDDLDGALEAVMAQVNEMEGYVESQSVSGGSAGSGRHRYANLTIRVPADRVDSFVEEVSGLTNLVSSSRNVQDITLTYSDTEGRVTALKTEETRLLELMEQAETMSDLLEIEARLTEVRYQLENYASTLRLYDNQVDYATVSLYITEVEKYTPVEEPGFWQKIKSGLADSLVNLGEAIVNFISWVIIDLPYLALIGLLVWLVTAMTKRSIRKRKAKKAAQKPKEEK
ncbi:MAG: DUF4349 domain-containing protein [Firmicutes bacterium]|nr:DUF4349 domain-containing protein [Bacillota bacterium]MDY6160181.1 DUF4349 domain-containing protein [Candidatus Faecousia sp.]